MTKYEKIESSNQELKIQVYYHKGGVNYFTYKNEERGYYLSVTPVTVERRDNGVMCETFTFFSGIKKCILPVQRQSEKQYKKACEIASEHEQQLKDHVLSKIQVLA